MNNAKPARHGFWNLASAKELNTRIIREVSEYKSEQIIAIACTQLSISDEKEKKRILNEWIKAIPNIPANYIHFVCHVPQKLLDAISDNKQIKGLAIKWTNAKSIGSLEKLLNLEDLRLGAASRVGDIVPISKLTKLKILFLENLMQVKNYSPISSLPELEHLSIQGGWDSRPTIESLEMLSSLKHLRSFHLVAMQCKNQSIEPLKNLKLLEDLLLCFDVNQEGENELQRSLPNLKFGFDFYKQQEIRNLARIKQAAEN
jgi:hypothetical protein